MNSQATLPAPTDTVRERTEPDDSAKRRQIVKGARTVFLDRGFEGASMGEIARIAGVSKGTLYVYFQNKEQLFCAIMEEERRTHLHDLWDIDVEPPIDVALKQFGRSLVSFLLKPQTIAAMRTAMGTAERMPEVGRTFYERGPGTTIKVVKDYLDRKVAAGQLAIDDTTMAATQLLDLMHSSLLRPALFGIELEETARERRIAEVVDAGVTVFIRAYGMPGGR